MAPEEQKMFKNPVMEFLATSGPKMMITFHFIIIATFIYAGYTFEVASGILIPVGIILGGFFFWTLAEYLLHRYVFHYIDDSKLAQKVHYAVHGYHHQVPKDNKRLFMPPLPATLLLAAFFGLFYLVMGKYAWFFLPGFELGYLAYAFIHYSIHTFRPPERLKPLWRHHALHHHKYNDLAFGVSNTFWDKVFGTMPPEETKVSK